MSRQPALPRRGIDRGDYLSCRESSTACVVAGRKAHGYPGAHASALNCTSILPGLKEPPLSSIAVPRNAWRRPSQLSWLTPETSSTIAIEPCRTLRPQVWVPRPKATLTEAWLHL